MPDPKTIEIDYYGFDDRTFEVPRLDKDGAPLPSYTHDAHGNPRHDPKSFDVLAFPGRGRLDGPHPPPVVVDADVWARAKKLIPSIQAGLKGGVADTNAPDGRLFHERG
jgi:hypothetical protein